MALQVAENESSRRSRFRVKFVILYVRIRTTKSMRNPSILPCFLILIALP